MIRTLPIQTLLLVKLIQIKAFETDNGKEPFSSWFNKIKDKKTKTKILIRLERVKYGNYGYHKRLKSDFLELKERILGGLRIYIGEHNENSIILLLGGNKSSQKKDIQKALEYWKEYKKNNIGGQNE